MSRRGPTTIKKTATKNKSRKAKDIPRLVVVDGENLGHENGSNQSQRSIMKW